MPDDPYIVTARKERAHREGLKATDPVAWAESEVAEMEFELAQMRQGLQRRYRLYRGAAEAYRQLFGDSHNLRGVAEAVLKMLEEMAGYKEMAPLAHRLAGMSREVREMLPRLEEAGRKAGQTYFTEVTAEMEKAREIER